MSPERPSPWTPDRALRADATDTQMWNRYLRFASDSAFEAVAQTAREFADARVAASTEALEHIYAPIAAELEALKAAPARPSREQIEALLSYVGMGSAMVLCHSSGAPGRWLERDAVLALYASSEAAGTVTSSGFIFPYTMDARVWATDFITHIQRNPLLATDLSVMQGWFANAIMAGFDEGERRAASPALTGRPTRADIEAMRLPHTGDCLTDTRRLKLGDKYCFCGVRDHNETLEEVLNLFASPTLSTDPE